MRILHVARGMANASGITHIVGPLAEAQARAGHSVRIFFVEKPNRQAVTPNPSLVESCGFPMTVPTEHIGWSQSFARALPAAVESSDVVHVHAIWNFPTWSAMREAHRASVPYIVAPQGSLESWALGRSRHLKAMYAALAEKPYFDRASAMQALTTTEADQCRQFGIRAPIEILPNGVDLATVDQVSNAADLRGELSLPSNSTLLLFLGRLFPKKGLDLLMPAVAALRSEHPDVVLLIAGGDAGTGYRTTLEKLAQDCGVSDRVRFIGEVRGDRKFAVMRGADLFLLPSYSEGLPVAALEAMACARPVVLSTNCNLPEVSAAEAGWLVDASVDSLVQGLRAALASATERSRRGLNGRRLIEEKYTWNRIAHESLRLYASERSN